MSLISKQIDELRAYAKDRKGELAKLINDAADTIEMLSAKLQASQMERSSQYYQGGWIPCSERLPKSNADDLEYPTALCCGEDGEIYCGCYYESTKEWGSGDYFDRLRYPIAWMPLPEPYTEKMSGDKQDEDTELS